LEKERLVHRLVDKALDGGLAERAEHAAAEAAGESLDADEADPGDLERLAAEEVNAGLAQDGGHFVLLAGLEIMVAEDGDDRHRGTADVFRQALGLLRLPGIGQVAAEDDRPRLTRHLGEEIAEGPARMLPGMQVADCRNSKRLAAIAGAFRVRHR